MGGGNHRDPIPMPDESSMDLDVVRSNSELHPADSDVSQFEEEGSVGVVVVHHLVTAMLVVMALALGTWGYLTFRKASFFELPNRQVSPFERSAVDAQVDRFHFALDVYFDLYNKYPASLDELVDEGLLQSSDLRYPPGSSTILYRRSADTYQIIVERKFVKTMNPDGSETVQVPAPEPTGGDAEQLDDSETSEPDPAAEDAPEHEATTEE